MVEALQGSQKRFFYFLVGLFHKTSRMFLKCWPILLPKEQKHMQEGLCACEYCLKLYFLLFWDCVHQLSGVS